MPRRGASPSRPTAPPCCATSNASTPAVASPSTGATTACGTCSASCRPSTATACGPCSTSTTSRIPRGRRSSQRRRPDQRLADALDAAVGVALDLGENPEVRGVARPHVSVLVDVTTFDADLSDPDDPSRPRPIDDALWADLPPAQTAWAGPLSPRPPGDCAATPACRESSWSANPRCSTSADSPVSGRPPSGAPSSLATGPVADPAAGAPSPGPTSIMSGGGATTVPRTSTTGCHCAGRATASCTTSGGTSSSTRPAPRRPGPPRTVAGRWSPTRDHRPDPTPRRGTGRAEPAFLDNCTVKRRRRGGRLRSLVS